MKLQIYFLIIFAVILASFFDYKLSASEFIKIVLNVPKPWVSKKKIY